MLRSHSPAKFDRSVVEHLACPACHAALSIDESRVQSPRLICISCARVYPIIDGIPVLIIDRAEQPGS